VKKQYHIVTRAGEGSASLIQQFCQANGQILLPLVERIQSASEVVNSVVHEISHQMLETILRLSAEKIAGPRTPGKPSGDIRWHGSQPGAVALADRRRGWRIGSPICTAAYIVARTAHNPHEECIYRRLTGGNVRWASRR
jgi:hypothetical protein